MRGFLLSGSLTSEGFNSAAFFGQRQPKQAKAQQCHGTWLRNRIVIRVTGREQHVIDGKSSRTTETIGRKDIKAVELPCGHAKGSCATLIVCTGTVCYLKSIADNVFKVTSGIAFRKPDIQGRKRPIKTNRARAWRSKSSGRYSARTAGIQAHQGDGCRRRQHKTKCQGCCRQNRFDTLNHL